MSARGHVAERTNESTARAAWGCDMPDWIAALARACDEQSQSEVARRIGRSAALVNHLLKRRYHGAMDRLEARVRGEFMRSTVDCPIEGAISTRACEDHQDRPLKAAGNFVERALWRACRICPHRRPS